MQLKELRIPESYRFENPRNGTAAPNGLTRAKGLK
jgi:hypothetical protein